MALSGSFPYSKYAGSGFDITWTATQDYSTLTTAVTINIVTVGGGFFSGVYLEYYSYSQPESIVLLNYPNQLTIVPGMLNSSRTFTVQHTGNYPAWFGLGFSGIINGQQVSGTQEFTLDAFHGASGVTSTNGYIGSPITITIASPSNQLTHTLTYSFGSLSGTIATKTTLTSVSWTLPSSFYNQIPDAISLTGTIYCETFSGTTSIGTTSCQFTASVDKTSCAPILTPTVKNISTDHVALTGNANTFIRYESMAEYAINAVAQNGATIVSQSITCGSKVITDLPQGVIDDVPSAIFIFRAVDSRGLVTEKTINKFIVQYVLPTCNQEVTSELVNETQTHVTIKIFGNIFNGSFGAVNNTMTLQIRYTDDDGNWGEWIDLPDIANDNFDGNTYTVELSGGDFDYNKNYLIQSRVTDKLHTVQSASYSIRVRPVFDWSKEDFNLNVPFRMNDQTILRHNQTANNIVLSATGGNIYLRPGGTDDTSSEVRIYSNGNLEIKGDLIINGVNITAALEAAGII